MIRRKEEGNETFCARSFLLDGVSSGTPSVDRTLGVLRVSIREEDEGQVGR